MGWEFAVVVWLICAGVGAAITNSKNRGVVEGLAWGGLLGVIGVVVTVCLSTVLPDAPDGMISVQCPRCNAVQNIPAGEPEYNCWQCQSVAAAPGFEDE